MSSPKLRPVISFHPTKRWMWECPVCRYGGRGYAEEHHAMTIGEEHCKMHGLGEFEGGSILFGGIHAEDQVRTSSDLYVGDDGPSFI